MWTLDAICRDSRGGDQDDEVWSLPAASRYLSSGSLDPHLVSWLEDEVWMRWQTWKARRSHCPESVAEPVQTEQLWLVISGASSICERMGGGSPKEDLKRS